MTDPAALNANTDTTPTSVRYVVLAALCLAALIAYAQRNSISVAEEAIRTDLGFTKLEMGWVMSAFFLTYAALQLPTGWIGKAFGTRRALSWFAATFSAMAALFSIAGGLPILIAARLGMGASQSGIFPCSVNTIARWLPENRRSMASGLLASSMSIGGALGGLLIGWMLPNIGWRIGFALIALPGFAFAIWFYWWFREFPEDHPAVNSAERALIRGPLVESKHNKSADDQSESTAAEPTPWGVILRNIPVLALCGQQVFRAAGFIFFGSWFATYLRETRGVTEDLIAGFLSSLPLLAIVLGSPLGGWLSDEIWTRTGSRRWSRQGVASITMLICFMLILCSYPIADPWLAVSLITAGAFFAAVGGPSAYTAAIDLGGKHVMMVFSLMNMAGNIGAFAFPILVPLMVNEDPQKPGSGNWDLVLFTFAGVYLAAAVCWLFVNPDRGVDEQITQEKQTEPSDA